MNRRDILKSMFLLPVVTSACKAEVETIGDNVIDRRKKDSPVRTMGNIEGFLRKNNFENMDKMSSGDCSISSAAQKEFSNILSDYVTDVICRETNVRFIDKPKECEETADVAASFELRLTDIRNRRIDIMIRAVESYAKSFVVKLNRDKTKFLYYIAHFYYPHVHRQQKVGFYGFYEGSTT
jgi:hypothetical protein